MRFVFPKGHPHEGKTISQGGVQFTDGAAEISEETHGAGHKHVEKIVTTYHGAVAEGSAEQTDAEAMYEEINADLAAKSSRKRAPKSAEIDPNAAAS